jgi:hypothetical protein
MGKCELRCETPEGRDRETSVGVLAYNLVCLYPAQNAYVHAIRDMTDGERENGASWGEKTPASAGHENRFFFSKARTALMR